MITPNAFTVDVEDYYHVSAFEGAVSRDHWADYESRVVANTRRLLELLCRHDVKATFFVLGWVARQHPHLVREIHASGHEIGSHSFWHRLIYEQTPDEFRADLVESRDVLQDIISEKVTSYRAPSFSVTKQTLWALDILVEEGFKIDSSVFPIYHDRYGIPDAPRALHPISTAAGDLWEFPISVRRVLGLNLPVSGGGYFRLFPLRWTVRSLHAIQRRRNQPFVFYIHPWELDPAQPRVAVKSRIARARHYVNRSTTERKLDRLLGEFRFAPLRDVVAAAAGSDHEAPGTARALHAIKDAHGSPC